MKQLEISTKELTWSRLIIQGFNQKAQWAIGMIHLELITIEQSSNTLLHVIDAKKILQCVTWAAMASWEWVISSTLH